MERTAPTKLKLGDVEVARIGLGTNRLTKTPEHIALVQEAVAAGVNLIDTTHTGPIAVGAVIGVSESFFSSTRC
jgi:hypothetical protein